MHAIRSHIAILVPDAIEALSYAIPVFKYSGQPLAGYAAYKKHCSDYPMSGSVIDGLETMLAVYETAKGAVRFPIAAPLPKALIKKLLEARIKQIEMK